MDEEANRREKKRRWRKKIRGGTKKERGRGKGRMDVRMKEGMKE